MCKYVNTTNSLPKSALLNNQDACNCLNIKGISCGNGLERFIFVGERQRIAGKVVYPWFKSEMEDRTGDTTASNYCPVGI